VFDYKFENVPKDVCFWISYNLEEINVLRSNIFIPKLMPLPRNYGGHQIFLLVYSCINHVKWLINVNKNKIFLNLSNICLVVAFNVFNLKFHHSNVLFMKWSSRVFTNDFFLKFLILPKIMVNYEIITMFNLVKTLNILVLYNLRILICKATWCQYFTLLK